MNVAASELVGKETTSHYSRPGGTCSQGTRTDRARRHAYLFDWFRCVDRPRERLLKLWYGRTSYPTPSCCFRAVPEYGAPGGRMTSVGRGARPPGSGSESNPGGVFWARLAAELTAGSYGIGPANKAGCGLS